MARNEKPERPRSRLSQFERFSDKESTYWVPENRYDMPRRLNPIGKPTRYALRTALNDTSIRYAMLKDNPAETKPLKNKMTSRGETIRGPTPLDIARRYETIVLAISGFSLYS